MNYSTAPTLYCTLSSSHTSLGSDHPYTAPCPGQWVPASVMTNSFLDPSTTSTLYSWFYLVWYYYLSVKFVMWIVKQKIEIKKKIFKKKFFKPHICGRQKLFCQCMQAYEEREMECPSFSPYWRTQMNTRGS